MAIGDVYADVLSFVGSDTQLIRPTGSIEVTLHNLWYNGSFTFYITDGVNDVQIDSVDTENDGFTYLPIHLTNSYYMKIIETGGIAGLIAYDGIVIQV